jgi:hypothetical protein
VGLVGLMEMHVFIRHRVGEATMRGEVNVTGKEGNGRVGWRGSLHAETGGD